jgi:hypothetical protein
MIRPAVLKRLAGFRGGLLLGALGSVLWVLAMIVGNVTASPPSASDYRANVRVDGQALSATGAATLRLQDGYETITIVCRGGCDDLTVLDFDALYGGYKAEALGPDGARISSGWGPEARDGGMIVRSLAGGAIVQRTHASGP